MIKTFYSLLKAVVFTKLSLHKTIYVNFKMLGFKEALKFPIYIYRNFKLENLNGKITINSDLSQGMVKIGLNAAGYVSAPNGSLRLLENSEIIFHGQAIISQGVQILVNKYAKLIIGNSSTFGDNVKIICYQLIDLGTFSRVAWESQIIDFSTHYIEDMSTNQINRLIRPIKIGDFCWIGNRSTVMPGTKLPNRTIVTSNSLINKDYIKAGIAPYSLMGGIPAKLIKTNVTRIFDKEQESTLHNYFGNNKVSSVHSDILKS